MTRDIQSQLRTSNMVEGFHRGFKSRVNRPKPTVQEYFRAIREQQVITDYHIDRLGVGKTPSKKRVKRKTSNDQLFQICSKSVPNTRITLARLTICLRLPNTLAMRLSNFMMILMNYYVEFELSLS